MPDLQPRAKPATRPSARHRAAPLRTQMERREYRLPAGRPHASAAAQASAHGAAPSRTASACACGGGCPRCRAKAAPQGPALSQPGDAHEREADAIAARIVAGGHATGATRATSAAERGTGLQRAPRGTSAPRAPAGLDTGGLRSASRPLDAATRRFMEAGFGHDFGAVRVHTGADAARSAAGVDARAYTVGEHIVFGPGEYAPSRAEGRRLLAHELAHVVQQSRGAEAFGTRALQRAPTIQVLPADFIGPPSPTQRRAAVSCPISCCFQHLGTLHAMPLAFTDVRRGFAAAGSDLASGIAAELHFMADTNQPAAADGCHCDGFHMIQIINSTHPYDARGRSDFVDNDPNSAQPFYGTPSGPYLAGQGEHEIPRGFPLPDAGERVNSTESIYDIPYRTPAMLGTTSLSWTAETCVSCVKDNAPDRVLGCVTYGFTRAYNGATHAFDPMVAVAPDCRSFPSQAFARTLRTDRTTAGYDFVAGPDFPDCPVGDFPVPGGDTRVA